MINMKKDLPVRKYQCKACGRFHFSQQQLSRGRDKACTVSPCGRWMEIRK